MERLEKRSKELNTRDSSGIRELVEASRSQRSGIWRRPAGEEAGKEAREGGRRSPSALKQCRNELTSRHVLPRLRARVAPKVRRKADLTSHQVEFSPRDNIKISCSDPLPLFLSPLSIFISLSLSLSPRELTPRKSQHARNQR